MADKKDIALTVGGILASIAVAYFVYRAETRNSAANNAASQDAAAQAELDSEAAQTQQQSFLASLASSVPSGGGATSWTGTGNSTSTDTTATTDTQENDSAGDGFSLSSLLSAYEQSLATVTAAGNAGATTGVPVYQAPVETFVDPTVTGGYPTGAAPILNGGGTSNNGTPTITQQYDADTNLTLTGVNETKSQATGGLTPAPPSGIFAERGNEMSQLAVS